MEYRRLGNSGLEVSIVGLGTNNFGGRMTDPKDVAAVVHECLDQGINLFDTSDSYGGRGASEELLGKALQGRREQAVVATKFASPMGEGPMTSGMSRRWIMQAVDDSLRRLGTNYIDLYQVHRPDAETPDEETMRALDDLVTSGKVRYIGHSNYTGWRIAHNHWIAETRGFAPFISAQNEYSLLDQRLQSEVIPACEKFGIGLLPFLPLASGLLTGKYRRGELRPEGARLSAGGQADRLLTDRNFDVVEKLDDFAQQRGHTILELAFSWLATQKVVGSVIAGATKPEQVKANAAAASWRLTPEEMDEVAQITRR